MGRDYILRMIEQIAAMLATARKRKQAGQIAEARTELDTLCIQTIGLTIADVQRLSPEAVAELLSDTGAFRPLRAVTLAELLLEQAGLDEDGQNPHRAISSDVHAFCLLADVMETLTPEEQTFYRPKLDLLADRLGELKSHPYLQARLRDYGVAEPNVPKPSKPPSSE